jgi:hypothetical protein
VSQVAARPRHRRRRGAAVVTVALVALTLAACSGGDDAGDGVSSVESGGDWYDGDAAAPEEAAEQDRGDAGGAADDGGAGGGDTGTGGTTAEPAPAPEFAALGRERIRTAWITLELDDPEAAVDEVAAAADANGGFVALADLTRDDQHGELGGTVTIRVPSANLLATLDDLEDLAVDAPERRIEEEDVGAQLTDLRAQLTNLTAYEQELRALLTEIREATSDPDDLLPIVERLQSVRSDIDRIRAQRDGLEERVALSTITVTLTSTRTAAPIATSDWAPLRTLQEALAATGRALATLADAAIWLVVTALPLVLVLAGPPLLLWRWVRDRRDARPDGPAHGPRSGPTAPGVGPAAPSVDAPPPPAG